MPFGFENDPDLYEYFCFLSEVGFCSPPPHDGAANEEGVGGESGLEGGGRWEGLWPVAHAMLRGDEDTSAAAGQSVGDEAARDKEQVEPKKKTVLQWRQAIVRIASRFGFVLDEKKLNFRGPLADDEEFELKYNQYRQPPEEEDTSKDLKEHFSGVSSLVDPDSPAPSTENVPDSDSENPNLVSLWTAGDSLSPTRSQEGLVCSETGDSPSPAIFSSEEEERSERKKRDAGADKPRQGTAKVLIGDLIQDVPLNFSIPFFRPVPPPPSTPSTNLPQKVKPSPAMVSYLCSAGGWPWRQLGRQEETAQKGEQEPTQPALTFTQRLTQRFRRRTASAGGHCKGGEEGEFSSAAVQAFSVFGVFGARDAPPQPAADVLPSSDRPGAGVQTAEGLRRIGDLEHAGVKNKRLLHLLLGRATSTSKLENKSKAQSCVDRSASDLRERMGCAAIATESAMGHGAKAKDDQQAHHVQQTQHAQPVQQEPLCYSPFSQTLQGALSDRKILQGSPTRFMVAPPMDAALKSRRADSNPVIADSKRPPRPLRPSPLLLAAAQSALPGMMSCGGLPSPAAPSAPAPAAPATSKGSDTSHAAYIGSKLPEFIRGMGKGLTMDVLLPPTFTSQLLNLSTNHFDPRDNTVAHILLGRHALKSVPQNRAPRWPLAHPPSAREVASDMAVLQGADGATPFFLPDFSRPLSSRSRASSTPRSDAHASFD